ncbi:MAG: magnesium chelatase, partial [Verrucomicrobiota bacterium]
ARSLQLERLVSVPEVNCNADMGSRQVSKYCQLDKRGEITLEQAMESLNFSARAHDRILKVARTLADLEGKLGIEEMHVLEAIQYRTLDRNLWS